MKNIEYYIITLANYSLYNIIYFSHTYTVYFIRKNRGNSDDNLKKKKKKKYKHFGPILIF